MYNMKYEAFEKIINSFQEQESKLGVARNLGLDLFDFIEPYHSMCVTLIEEIYGPIGAEWFCWFCYENDFGTKGHGAWDENKNPICYDIKSLWNYLETEKSKNI
jgi:hypothetical protein